MQRKIFVGEMDIVLIVVMMSTFSLSHVVQNVEQFLITALFHSRAVFLLSQPSQERLVLHFLAAFGFDAVNCKNIVIKVSRGN